MYKLCKKLFTTGLYCEKYFYRATNLMHLMEREFADDNQFKEIFNQSILNSDLKRNILSYFEEFLEVLNDINPYGPLKDELQIKWIICYVLDFAYPSIESDDDAEQPNSSSERQDFMSSYSRDSFASADTTDSDD